MAAEVDPPLMDVLKECIDVLHAPLELTNSQEIPPETLNSVSERISSHLQRHKSRVFSTALVKKYALAFDDNVRLRQETEKSENEEEAAIKQARVVSDNLRKISGEIQSLEGGKSIVNSLFTKHSQLAKELHRSNEVLSKFASVMSRKLEGKTPMRKRQRR